METTTTPTALAKAKALARLAKCEADRLAAREALAAAGSHPRAGLPGDPSEHLRRRLAAAKHAAYLARQVAEAAEVADFLARQSAEAAA